MSASSTDCVLFIDEEMARFIIAWNRRKNRVDGEDRSGRAIYSAKDLAVVLNITMGQVRGLVSQAVAVGIMNDAGDVSEMAMKCVTSIVGDALRGLTNRR